jgi:hypothetical protein
LQLADVYDDAARMMIGEIEVFLAQLEEHRKDEEEDEPTVRNMVKVLTQASVADWAAVKLDMMYTMFSQLMLGLGAPVVLLRPVDAATTFPPADPTIISTAPELHEDNTPGAAAGGITAEEGAATAAEQLAADVEGLSVQVAPGDVVA